MSSLARSPFLLGPRISSKSAALIFCGFRITFLAETLVVQVRRGFKSALKEKQASIQAMKFYGRQSEGNAERILDGFKEFQEAAGNTPELQEIYNELKFEFEYYRRLLRLKK